MALIKTDQELELLREGGAIWKEIRKEILSFIGTGVNGIQVCDKVTELFGKFNVTSAFKGVDGFPADCCISHGDVVIHGVPTSTPFKKGDKVAVDIGFWHKGVVIDSAFTVLVDEDWVRDPVINTGYQSLLASLKVIKNGCTVGDIAYAVESCVSGTGFSIIDGFGGHGCGVELHETPHIKNKGVSKGEGEKLMTGMVICIEPMIMAQSDGQWVKSSNGFDILTKKKGAQTCHWECQVIITEDGYEAITL